MGSRVGRTHGHPTGAPEKQQENEKRKTEQTMAATVLELTEDTHLHAQKTRTLPNQ